jgi:hypothetical protein
MWSGGASDGFNETIQRIAARTLTFGKPVLVMQGDSHAYKVDNPLAWRRRCPASTAASGRGCPGPGPTAKGPAARRVPVLVVLALACAAGALAALLAPAGHRR